MFIIRLIRFLRGYLCFTASDGFPERFLNLCNQAGVVVWDVAWNKNDMAGKTDRRGFALMQDCAAPAGVVLKARRKVGLPFFLQDYRRRAGLLVGLLVCVITLAVLSGRVWTIEVRGNAKLETETILLAMQQQGVRLGASRSKLDAKAISAATLRKLPGLSWISLNLKGSSAVIEVREELPLQMPTDDSPRDIVAAKTGQLKILEIYSGRAHAGLGEAVLKGSLLAGGEVENADATHRYVRAVAYAVARTNIACQAVVPRRETIGRVALPKTHYTLCILNVRIPLGPPPKNRKGQQWTTRFAWEGYGGRVLPLAVERVSFVDNEPQTRVKNDRQLRLAAAEQFYAKAYESLRAAQFLQQEVTVQLGEDSCEAALEGRAYENIGLPKALE